MDRKSNVQMGAVSIVMFIMVGRARAADFGTVFTYQGFLEKPAGSPVDDTCNFRIRLFDVLTGGSEVTAPDIINGVPVNAGVFTVNLDFFESINGSQRFLGIEVQCTGDPAFVVLTPRVELKPVPYALALRNFRVLQANQSPAVVGGHASNSVDFVFRSGVTISGGGNSTDPNRSQNDYTTIGGGKGNVVEQRYGTIGGGQLNTAGELDPIDGFCTIGGGSQNTVIDFASTVSGGSGNRAEQSYAVVPGGFGNVAGGYLSFAAGNRAHVRTETEAGNSTGDQGTFIWADSTNAQFTSTGEDQFLIRASGGVGINTNNPDNTLHVQKASAGAVTGHADGVLVVENNTDAYIQMLTPAADERGILFGEVGNSAAGGIVYNASGTPDGLQFRTNGNFTKMVIEADGTVGILRTATSFPLHVGTDTTNGNGAHVTAGGTWVNGSDRDSKMDFAAIDQQEILQRVAEMPITQWQYKGEPVNVRHMGPVAQDFHEAFGLGHDERYITTIDADGVALAAIQGLHQLVQEKDCEIDQLREDSREALDQLKSEIAELKEAVQKLSQIQGGVSR